jgi:hypothetical protein
MPHSTLADGIFVGSYGLYMWHPEHGAHLIKEEDRARFSFPGAQVFKCVGIESPWLLLEYAGQRFHVLPDIFQLVPAPSFFTGDRVQALTSEGERSAEVVDVYWHFKNRAPYYHISLDGRRSSRRYTASELTRV